MNLIKVGFVYRITTKADSLSKKRGGGEDKRKGGNLEEINIFNINYIKNIIFIKNIYLNKNDFYLNLKLYFFETNLNKIKTLKKNIYKFKYGFN